MNIKCSAKNSKYFKKLSHDINEYYTITSQTLTLRHCYVDLLLIFTKFYFIFQKMYKLPKIYTQNSIRGFHNSKGNDQSQQSE